MPTIISSFTNNFLDTAVSAPYIGPVNARSAPAAASRRPRKKRTKKQAGIFPPSGPPPPIGHPICHPMRHPPMRHPLRRRGLTAGPRPVRPSASAGPCCPAMPPPVSSALPLGREAGKFPIGIFFAQSRIAVSQRFCGVGAFRGPSNRIKTPVGRPVCPFSGIRSPATGRPLLQKNPLQRGRSGGGAATADVRCGTDPQSFAVGANHSG